MTTPFTPQAEADLETLEALVRADVELTPELATYRDELTEARRVHRIRTAAMAQARLALASLRDHEARAAEMAEREARQAELDAAAAEAERELRERVAAELGCSVDEVEARVAAMEPEPTPVYDHVPDPNGGSRLVPHQPIELLDEETYRRECAEAERAAAEAKRRERLAPVHRPDPEAA